MRRIIVLISLIMGMGLVVTTRATAQQQKPNNTNATSLAEGKKPSLIIEFEAGVRNDISTEQLTEFFAKLTIEKKIGNNQSLQGQGEINQNGYSASFKYRLEKQNKLLKVTIIEVKKTKPK